MKKAFLIFSKIEIPSPTGSWMYPSYNLKKDIDFNILQWSDTMYMFYIAGQKYDLCKRINEVLNFDKYKNFEKLLFYPLIYDEEKFFFEDQKINKDSILFFTLGIEKPEGHHANFAIIDFINNRMAIYEPRGKLNFTNDDIEQYNKIIKKLVNTDIEIEKLNIEEQGIQQIFKIPYCNMFSTYMQILVFTMYSVASEEEKKYIFEWSQKIEYFFKKLFVSTDDMLLYFKNFSFFAFPEVTKPL